MAKEAKVSFVPTGDRFLVRREKVKRETAGGIHLPDNMREGDVRGTCTVVVLAAGPGTLLPSGEFRRAIECRPGDRLLLDSVHDACWIDDPERPGDKLHFVKAIDVLAVLQ